MTIKERIKAEGYALGFSFVGFALPDPPEHYAIYSDWLDAGHHGTMHYLAAQRNRERRANPQLILPECKTIIVLAANYPNPLSFPESTGEKTFGRIAAYAWPQDDYHITLPPLLEKLAQSIQTILGKPVKYRYYTDTGPILEREFARRAGLGWIGKNTCLISPDLGSFLFLAEILIDQFIEPDPPFTADRCGSCTKCIDSCPTQCILPDRTIDASKCISYLTIENKDEMPASLRSKLGNWVFGCDICQLVCPWNHKTRDTAVSPIFKNTGPVRVDLQQEIQLSSQEFNEKYRNSPIKRAKRKAYLRTLAIALGNTRNPEMIDLIMRVLQTETEPLVRAHLIWALGNIGTGRAREFLLQLQADEKDPQCMAEIASALVK